MRVSIVDYGSGNLRSVAKAVTAAVAASPSAPKAQVITTSDSDQVAKSDYLVLPGVGAFADCWAGLAAIDGMQEAIASTAAQRPFLGICVGMQLMAEYGLEGGVKTPGFGWVTGCVAPITPQPPKIRVPHMGWNTLALTQPHPVFSGLAKKTADEAWVYFLHGYHMTDTDAGEIIATTDYGTPIVAAVARDTRIGVQFHPEKSQALGQTLLANWLAWRP